MADKLGQPLMPHQRLVADVGGEIDPVTGLPAYREVIVTVPRQSGKTTLFLSWQINRCVSRRWKHPQRSVFTAQTGKDARDKWIDELFPLIRNSRLKSLVATTGDRLVINEGMGNESILFKTGSRIRLLSTSTSSGHSKTLHQAVMDEIWHDSDDRREQGLRPAMITISDAQLLVCSTAGTEASVVLNRKVETGRAAVEADTGFGVAYFEWSAAEDFDPYDEASWFTFMPALCPDPPCRCAGPGETWRHTITSLDAIRAERDAMEPAEFKRAYGNVPTGPDDLRWQVVGEATWSAVLDDTSALVGSPVFAVDTNPERTYSAIAVVGSRADGHIHGEIVEHRPGTDWVIDRVVELTGQWKPAMVVADPGGAAGSLVAGLAKAITLKFHGLMDVTLLTARDVAQGFGMFHDVLSPKAPRKLRVLPNFASLTAAVAGAATRRIGDGTTWDRKSTSTDISPLVALTNALHGHMSLPPPPPPPSTPSKPPNSDHLKAVFRPSQRLKL